MPGVDPLSAAEVLGAPSFYWERPADGEAVAGYGRLAVEEATTRRDAYGLLTRLCGPSAVDWRTPGLPRPRGPWFGGLAFDLARAPGAAWAGFPLARWVLPEVMVWTREGRAFVTVFSPAGMDGRAPVALPRGRREAKGEPRALTVHADRPAWDRLIGGALAAIEAGTLSKVVAARAIDVEAEAPFAPVEVLAALRTRFPSCTTFLFGGSAGAVFVGATPETLCRVENGTVEVDSLAGTASPRDSQEWTSRDKERREHGAVTEAIREGLGPLCDSIEIAGEPQLLKLANVVHLRTPIRARLKRGVSAAEVVKVLHPTPAVGGAPRDRALAFLTEHEGLDRGWYAGAVGWVGEGAAELKVGLRSARLDGAKARVFVGAGVVRGSVAEGEWRETELKSTTMLDALRGGPSGNGHG